MHLKTWLMAAGAGLMVTSPALAEPATAVDELVVAGARLQGRRAVEAKRTAENIVDSITADEVGALPDFSLSEALRRVPGVSTEDRNGDAEYVVVRGLRADFNAIQIDGALAPSTRFGGRATQLSVIPSYVVKRTDVVKSFSADMDANVLGGQFDLRTRSAFDQDGLYLTARAAAGAYDHDKTPDKVDPALRADFAVANRFGPDEAFGLVAGGSYLRADYGTWLPGVAFNEYDFIEPDGARRTTLESASSQAVRVPHGAQMYQYLNELERKSGYAKLEFRPNDRLALAASIYQFEETDTEQRWDTTLFRNQSRTPAELTPVGGLVPEGSIYNQYFWQTFDVRLRGVAFSGEYAPAPRHRLSALLAVTDGRQENPFYQTRFDTGVSTRNAYRYDNSGPYPVLTLLDPTAWTDAARYKAIFYRPRLDIAEQAASQAKVDYAYNSASDDRGLGVKLGAAWRSDKRTNDQLFDNDFRPNSAATRAFSLADALLGKRRAFEPNLISGLPQLYTDEAAFLKYFDATAAQWRDAKTPAAEALSSDYSVKEKVGAAYVAVQFASERMLARLGLRYERTKVRGGGAQQLSDADPLTPSFVLVEREDAYDNLLPSAAVTFDVAPLFRLRAAYSRTLGRADYDDLSLNGARTVDDAMRTISVTAGNPDLKPRISDNFDLSLERYFPQVDGLFAVGLFHKRIRNEVFTRTVRYETNIDGVAYEVNERRPENANNAEVTGVEIGVTIGSLSFLSPHLADVGFSGNYAHIDSEFTLETTAGTERTLYGLIAQPREIGNFTLFYRPGRLDLRLAFNYRGRYLQSASASSPTFDEYFGIERRLDAQVRYDLGRGVSLFAEARNLTDDASDQLLSYGPIHWTRDYGRSAWVGATYAF